MRWVRGLIVLFTVEHLLMQLNHGLWLYMSVVPLVVSVRRKNLILHLCKANTHNFPSYLSDLLFLRDIKALL